MRRQKMRGREAGRAQGLPFDPLRLGRPRVRLGIGWCDKLASNGATVHGLSRFSHLLILLERLRSKGPGRTWRPGISSLVDQEAESLLAIP